jgi:rhodanese-related sulfurtransferase
MSGASSPQQTEADYAGDISAKESWGCLEQDPKAILIDVRTQAEWSFVGIPDLSSLSRDTILVEWQTFPPGPTPNPNFDANLAAALDKEGYQQGNPIFFLGRSGARSRGAAIAATAAGYGPCFNVGDGFEGGLDAEQKRGRAEGWKAAGLPWIQS